MTFQIGSWFILLLATGGFFLLLYAFYFFLRDLFYWFSRPKGTLSRTARQVARIRATAVHQEFMHFEFPWLLAYSLTVPMAIVLWLMLSGASFQYMALIALAFPLLARYWMARTKRHEAANEIRQFLVELRLQLSAGGTLRPALEAVALTGPPNLRRILRTRLSSSERGAQVLQLLAEDTGSRWLKDVAGRAAAAQDGMLNLDEAVAQSIERVTQEMDTDIREQLEQIPTRLVVFVSPLLLGPTLALLVYPIVARTLASIEGVTFFGKF